jgi:DNA-3-methyladenine glycosylase
VTDDRRLCAGPGRLTQAMGIAREHNGADFTRPPLYLARGRTRPVAVATGPRVGVTVATQRPWRFYVEDSPFVSR